MYIIWVMFGGLIVTAFISLVLEVLSRKPPSKKTLALQRRIQRDNELLATFAVLEEMLGRTPTTAEVWDAAPPWFSREETA